jgi:hypothetical protein
MKLSAFLRFLVIIFLSTSLFFLAPPASFAQTTVSPIPSVRLKQTSLPVANTNPDVPNNLHNWTQNVMIEVLSALSCQLSGIDPVKPSQPCLGIDQKNGKIGFLPSPQTGGAIGFVGSMITVLYTPPLHTSDYFQYLSQNFGISKHAYAQTNTGTGFDGLRPLMAVWVIFRNLVYLILVIVFVVIGLAIMLRIKIDPRTVMTIQNQIPKVIVGILAITFSFAIAGFLIDMMWVLIYLIHNTLTQAAGYKVLDAANIQSNNPFGLLGAGNIWSISWESSKGVAVVIMDLLGMKQVASSVHWWDVFIPGKLLLTTLALILQGLIGFIGGVIVFIIICIALLMALCKLWITLLKAYVTILLDVILAPFWIVGGIIPGSPISLTGWLKDIGANLLAFPATIAMFMLAIMLKNILMGGEEIFVPPLIGNPMDSGLLGALVALGIILMTPNVVDMIKQAVKAPKTDFGTGAAMKGIGVGAALTTKSVSSGAGLYGAATFDISGEKRSAGRGGRVFQRIFRG